LALHDEHGHEIFDKAQERQQRKYTTFPSRKKVNKLEDAKCHKKRKKLSPSVASVDTDVDDEEQFFEEDDCMNELPAAAFPYHKDLLFGADHADKVPFNQTDQFIEFVCLHLHHHGLGFLLNEVLDEHQLDLIMVASWGILHSLKDKPDVYPSKKTVKKLSDIDAIQTIFSSVPTDDTVPTNNTVTVAPSTLEATCKNLLPCTLPSRDINLNAIDAKGPVKYQYSLPIALRH